MLKTACPGQERLLKKKKSSNDLEKRDYFIILFWIFILFRKEICGLKKKLQKHNKENHFSRQKTELGFSRIFPIILKMIKLLIYFSCFLYFCSLRHIDKWARNQQNYQRKSNIRAIEIKSQTKKYYLWGQWKLGNILREITTKDKTAKKTDPPWFRYLSSVSSVTATLGLPASKAYPFQSTLSSQWSN